MKKDNSADIEDILGLTPMQEGLLFHYMSDPSGNYYYEQLCLDIAGEIDLQYVEQAWNRVIRQNEMLRAVFRWEKVKQPVQLIRKTHCIRIRTNDLSTKTPGERKQLSAEIENGDRREGFDLRDVPFRVTLVRTGRDTFRMIIGSHHILYDGWSSALILGEFFDAYAHLTTGFTPVIPVKAKFKDYVKWLREQETSESAGYWKEYLSGIQCSTGLSIKEKTFLNEGGGSYFIEFPPDDTAVIGDFLKSNKLTLAVLFYSAWGILLREYNNTRDTGDVVTGTTVSGRSVPIEGIEHTVGLFINTLPLRIRTRSGESGLQLLRRTAEALRARQPYESTPLVKIREYSGLAAREALFDTIVVIENYPLDISVMPANRGLSVTSYTMLESTHYDVTVRVENIDGIKVDFSYSADVPGEAIVRLAGHFQRIVRGLIANPDKPLKTIDMLSREERRQILVDFNDTGVSFPEDKTIHQLFEEQAARTPDRVALIEYRSYMTYNQLDKISNRLARQLFEKGVGPGTAVAVMEERSIEMMVRIFAILKAGAAYLPIDPGYPPNRIRYMLQDSNAWVLMSEVDRLSELSGEGTTHLTHLTQPTHLGYIIYTSGSSGRPRGVMVEHRSLVNRLTWMQKNFPLGAGDVILQKTPITFDVSVWELFWWGIAGASLCLLAPGGEKDPAVIIETVERDRVTVMHFVPSMLQAMLEYIEMGGSASRLSGLRRVFASGESLSPSQVKRFNRLFQARLTNLYGPTEATIDVSYYNCYGPGHTHPDTIPIGKPIDNVKLYILDKYLKLQPIGIPGELYISGTGVARGYLNRPELTGENFNKSYKSYRTYKTGDLARWLSDGNIQFLGRLDLQVKVRGFRIELGEIEKRLLQHGAIKEAVVSVTEAGGSLCAYIVAGRDTGKLSEYLAQYLPDYMIPSFFVEMKSLPLTSNGKIDRGALPEPDKKTPVATAFHVPPVSEIEKKIVRLWKEVLNRETVGVRDNFFDLGGHSLHVIRLTGRLNEVFEKEISVTTLFRYPTIRSLVEHLQGETREETTPHAVPDRPRASSSMEIAVIGMAVRFPGAPNIDIFWENLKNGIESIAFFSDRRLEEAGVSTHELNNPHYVKAKGVLANNHCFDAGFFEYSPREAQLMDPQLRILHECVWEGLENAGYDATNYSGLIGLYAGALSNNAWLMQVSDRVRNHTDWLAVGSLTDRDFFSTRIAYKLNLRGPAVTIQTACSTSLTAIAAACRALETRECDIALAGGVSISLEDETGYLYQEGMVRSPDGHCRAFDAGAGGTVGGNGAGIVVLKPLAAAEAERDRIHAVIRGAAVNNDGVQKIGYTAPSVEGQAAVIRAALGKARVEPESISYIEAHGTGTKLGDPVEMEALGVAFNSSQTQYCAVGSVKTNIGHLDAAAGVAGFIKTVLALEHRLIPPSLHFEHPNPSIDFGNSPFYINTRLLKWENHRYPLRAGVSSFGIGGTNAHVILEESRGGVTPPVPGRRLIILSARTEKALDKMTQNLSYYLEQNNHAGLGDAAYTLQVGRRAFEHRRTAVVTDSHDAVTVLSSPRSSRVRTFVTKENYRPVVFIFSGQGSQYVDMGRGIYQNEPLFRETLDHCFEILKPLTGFDLKTILYPGGSGDHTGSPLHRTHITQPVLFAFEYALARLLMDWGIKPHTMIGHSIGEYAAACIAGVFTLEEGLRLVAMRGKLMEQMPPGDMLSVSLNREDAALFLNNHLSLAAVNSPSSCVVSGPVENIRQLAADLEEAGIQNRVLHTSHAFHSAMMDPVLEQFREILGPSKLAAPQIPYISNVSGTWTTEAEARDPGYWAAQLRNTVRFSDGLTEVLKEENAVLIEIGPGRTLSTFARRNHGKNPTHEILNLVRHPKEEVPDIDFLLERVGRLWGTGVEIDWERFNFHRRGGRIPLPTYPFAARPFPMEKKIPTAERTVVEEGKKKDIADWFYVPLWRQSPPRYTVQPVQSGKIKERFTWLVFIDDTRFGRRLLKQLEKAGQTVVRVEKGEQFSRKRNRIYTIDPRMGSDYEKLFEALPGIREKNPPRILHLWGVTSPLKRNVEDVFQTVDRDLDLGFYSLLHLARTIGGNGITAPVYIDVITSGVQPVVGDEPLRPGKAAVLGAVKVIPLEYPNVRCRAIDIYLPESRSIAEDKLIENLLAELSSQSLYRDPAGGVVFRGGARWVQEMEPLRFEKSPEPHPRLRQNGVYLVTGGFGGIGYTLAQHLARSIKACLILVGRSPLTPGGEWLQKVKRLEELGAEVQASSCDVSDLDGMKTVIDEAVARFGAVNGVLHTAGVADYAGIIQRRTPQMDRDILAPKIKGTLVLDKLLAVQALDFFVLFSTIGNIAYGRKFGQAAYAAANEFLDVYSYYRTARTGAFTAAVNWSDWQQVGMAVTAASHWAKTLRLKDAPRTLLTDALLPSEGIEALLRILAGNFARAAVSPVDLTVKIENDAAAPALLEKTEEKKAAPEPGISMGETEQVISRTWAEFLGVEAVAGDDNFFDLGASSLDIMQVNSRLNEALQTEIPIVTMYAYPTVHSLARYLRRREPGLTGREQVLAEQKEGFKRSKQAMTQTIRKIRSGGND